MPYFRAGRLAGRADSYPKADSPRPDNQWGRAFIGARRGLLAETTQGSSDSHPEVGHVVV